MPREITRICLADDDEDDHYVFATILKDINSGIALHGFRHCDKLIDYLNDDNSPLPDLIFLDMNMPGNDGHECLRLLKKTARLMHIPVVMYSTSAASSGIEECYKNGAFRYIVKPNSL